VTDATADVGIQSWPIASTDPDYVSPDGTGGFFPDHWTQDFFDVGATYLPAPDRWQRLGIAMRLKPPMPSGYFAEKELFGPDWTHTYGFQPSSWEWNDNAPLNEGGNLEVVPPHDGYPAGRIIVGSHMYRFVDRVHLDFLNAQYAQAPILTIDTRWLVVGHVDEALGFVQDSGSPRGWKATLTAPRQAWQILEGLVAENPANADLVLFEGQSWGYEPNLGVADITIAEILEDPELAAANDAAQAEADIIKELLMREVGLADDDFVSLPFTWEQYSSGPSGELRYIAHIPNTVNLQTFDGVALVARPFGPVIDGEDVFERVTRDRIEPLGIDVRFVDGWNLYHRGLGETHCGTQADRTIPRDVPWWEMDR
jgi:protein-arginine deiminase